MSATARKFLAIRTDQSAAIVSPFTIIVYVYKMLTKKSLAAFCAYYRVWRSKTSRNRLHTILSKK